MTFTSPTPLAEALKLLNEKRLVPTALSSADLRELAAEVRRAALFSARMTQIRPLQALLEGLTDMLEGKGNVADAKLLLTQVYTALGYDAEAGGFPQDKSGTVEPATRGTLRDLASQRRMELTITTNYRMLANEAFVKRTTEDEQRRYQFPCYELVRIEPRITPRGFIRRKGGDLDIAPGEDWPSRFVAAGGELYEKGTRMIAPKGSDVWVQLGAGAGGYRDTLGNPFAPFAFGSGYGLRELPRGECLLIGVITEDDVIAKMPVTLQGALKAQAKKIDPKILEEFDDLEDDGEWLRLAKAKQDKVEAARKLRNRVETMAVLMNGGTRGGALLGWLTRRKHGWTPLQMQETRKGMKAMREVITSKEDRLGAMNLPGVGLVDFRWSIGPRGVRRIYEDHKIARRIPLILARGKVTQGKARVFVDYKGHRVVLAKDLFGKPSNHWVLTGYRDKEKSHPMNSVKIPIQQSLRSRSLHVLREPEGAGGREQITTLRARCKLLAQLLHS